tara:strand:+ start:164 stop:457 length:294 start_codon:yes stop_codon:yes gene_type:complete
MQKFLISYKFKSSEDKIKGGKMLLEWYESKGPEKRPSNYIVHSWIFLIQNGTGHSVVSSDSLETIWQQWNPWSYLMEISIEPCLDLDETVSLFKKIS